MEKEGCVKAQLLNETSITTRIAKNVQLLRQLPAEVSPEQIIEFVKAVMCQGARIGLSSLSFCLHMNMTELMPVLRTSEILDLITRTENQSIMLSEIGKEFRSGSQSGRVQLLGKQLQRIEPFYTALAIVSGAGRTSSKHVANALLERNVRWNEDYEINNILVHNLLVNWAIFANLLEYDGRTRKFQIPGPDLDFHKARRFW